MKILDPLFTLHRTLRSHENTYLFAKFYSTHANDASILCDAYTEREVVVVLLLSESTLHWVSAVCSRTIWCMHLIDPIYLALEMQTVRSRISYVIRANCAQRNQKDSAILLRHSNAPTICFELEHAAFPKIEFCARSPKVQRASSDACPGSVRLLLPICVVDVDSFSCAKSANNLSFSWFQWLATQSTSKRTSMAQQMEANSFQPMVISAESSMHLQDNTVEFPSKSNTCSRLVRYFGPT